MVNTETNNNQISYVKALEARVKELELINEDQRKKLEASV